MHVLFFKTDLWLQMSWISKNEDTIYIGYTLNRENMVRNEGIYISVGFYQGEYGTKWGGYLHQRIW